MFHTFLQRMFRVGSLGVRHPDGQLRTYGDGSEPEVIIRVSGRGVRRILANPQLGLGEGYMEGDVALERGDIWALFEVIGRNRAMKRKKPRGPLQRAVRKVRRQLQQLNDRHAALKNASHHYDLSYDLYRRFLDADMQYTCAYFPRPNMTLEEAQAAKKAHVAAKLRLEPGMRVLDIGCGWGGLALELGGRYGCEVLGITLAEEQLVVAQRRAREAGLDDRVKFSLTDYRDVEGPFDRIVSVGMFEAVGVPHFKDYFRAIEQLLTDDGIAVIHTIGRRTPPTVTNPWIAKYIFPGGYIPSISETLAAVEEIPLWVTDIEVLRLHYGETLRLWRERFNAERAAIAALYDERFCRMWEFYLAGAELAFRYGDQMNFQLQLAKKVDALPMSRDYMIDDERRGPVAGTRAPAAAQAAAQAAE